ncbi:hypothetical protein [Novosphingobium terrae]|uniref:hypothetical protein n=1 Tax=Novosphingobium terrae TaxID=2726189 RepID=UPI00197E9095|nr:hypothetical protein [Novosphingobium terrae]
MTFRAYQASILALIASCCPLTAVAGTGGGPSPLPSFSTMEFEMPADSLKASSDPLWKSYATRQTRMAPMRDEILAAIPAGTSAQTAQALLQQAGARCRSAAPDRMACDYHTVETRDEFLDDVHWNVDVGVRDGAVDQLSVQRNWVRH